MAERVSINEALPFLQGVVEWEELGLHLGLSDAVIKEIRSAVGDVSIKRMVMMSRWLQSDLEATWSKLAKALLKMNPPYKVVAAKIRQQRGLSPEHEVHNDTTSSQEPSGGKCKVLVKLFPNYSHIYLWSFIKGGHFIKYDHVFAVHFICSMQRTEYTV